MKKKENTTKFIAEISFEFIKNAPVLAVLSGILGILHSVFNVFNVIILQKFLDKVTLSAEAAILIKYLLYVVVSLILSQIFMGLHNVIYDIFAAKSKRYLYGKLYTKVAEKDAVLFEQKEFLDDISKSEKGVEGFIELFAVISTFLTFYIPYFLFLETYLASMDKTLILTVLFIFIPVIITQFLRVKIFKNLENNTAFFRRKFKYYNKCITDKEYFKETRSLKAEKYFEKFYKKYLNLYNKEYLKSEKKSAALELVMKLITLCGYAAVLLILCNSLFKNNITIGFFIAVFNSIELMIVFMEELICIHFGKFTHELGAVKNLAVFLNQDDNSGAEKEINFKKGIELENVSFKYPGSDKYALKNINLTIKPKETIAIVGFNGSGKTTLTKIITGMYKPEKGTVKADGISLATVKPKIIFDNISVMFQKFAKYKLNFKDNVIISSPKEYNQKNMDEALKIAELDMEKLKIKPDTVLSREFNGTDLSGGQWQRIAIARCFYKKHSMVILDEPTSAIDPLEEDILYRKFKEVSKDVISVIVTHKIGSAKIADRIIVLDKGEIIQIGSHDELIRVNGKYKELYDSQKKWYIEK